MVVAVLGGERGEGGPWGGSQAKLALDLLEEGTGEPRLSSKGRNKHSIFNPSYFVKGHRGPQGQHGPTALFGIRAIPPTSPTLRMFRM